MHAPEPDSSEATNPFQPRTPDGPFVGREAALARLHHSLTQARAVAPVIVTGRRGIGKSALLRQFVNRDPSLVGVLVDASTLPCDQGERAFLLALLDAVIAAVEAQGFTLDALVHDPPAGDVRVWLAEQGLPALYRAIWRRRRFALLLENAHYLLAGLAGGALPADLPAYLRGLTGPQFGLALALTDADSAPDHLALLADLAPADHVLRLGLLTADEVTMLCRAWLPARDMDAPTLATRCFSLTGGDPLLIHHLAYHWLHTPDLKQAAQAVYAENVAHFRALWQDLDPDERLVLAAIAALLYEDPLKRVDAPSIEAWLVRTDHPRDLTAVHAALRGLDYRQLVSGSAAGTQLNGELLLRWLVEHAGQPAVDALPGAARPLAPLPADSAFTLRGWLIVLLLAILLLVGIMAAARLGRGEPDPQPPVPTVTLVPR